MAKSKFNQKNRKPTKKGNSLKAYKKKVKAQRKLEAKKLANRQKRLAAVPPPKPPEARDE